MIPDAVRERKKVSTCNRDMAQDARSKIVSFQKLLPARKNKMGDLLSTSCGNQPICMRYSRNATTAEQYTGRNWSCHFLVHIEHALLYLSFFATKFGSRSPVERYASPHACWQPRSKQKNLNTSCYSVMLHVLRLRFDVGPRGYVFLLPNLVLDF